MWLCRWCVCLLARSHPLVLLPSFGQPSSPSELSMGRSSPHWQEQPQPLLCAGLAVCPGSISRQAAVPVLLQCSTGCVLSSLALCKC